MPKKSASFFIVTPCFNGMPFLPGCVASVRAQAGDNIRVHHHVQDAGSTDGTVDWLERYAQEVRDQRSEIRSQRSAVFADGSAEPQEVSSDLRSPTSDLCPAYTFSYESAADEGMYDAINKGWDRADEFVDWLGHLNSDEQYQPGMLERTARAGTSHPSWVAITGNCIWVNDQGDYLCSRKPSVGWPWVGRIWIPAFTCALFVRREFYGKEGVRFDTSWKSFGDKVFCRDLLNIGCKFGYLDDYMALFTHRGDENLGFQPITGVERKRYWDEELTSLQRRLSPLSIFTAKVSRVLRSSFGRRCRSYVWIDPYEVPQNIAVKNHRWMI
jgi:glycosyltransferase involved in cell wall biosynthesis